MQPEARPNRQTDPGPTIDRLARKGYQGQLTQLVERVNEILSSRKDIQELIGEGNLELMFENHKHHAALMANVFYFDNYSLLTWIAPWVYRTYSNHGFAYAYFPVHFQAWQQALQELLPADQAAALVKVYAWLAEQHQEFISRAEQGLFLDIQIQADWQGVNSEFLQAVLRGDRQASLQISRRLVKDERDLQVFYRNLVVPSMYRIGQLWEQGEISVAREHLASATVNMVMSLQYAQVLSGLQPSKGRALVTAAANEFHELGAQMIANALEIDGWDVDYLGANTPNQGLIDLIRDMAPSLLALSITMPFNLIKAQTLIEALRTWPAKDQPWIMLGGLAFHGWPDLPREMGADGFAADCTQAVSLARDWWETAADGP